eukprot:TRINITY_DN1235_c0_g1_i1.p1 TRINITY_DN1235_c0_g1~~TRINITY_DN1235_c0_g1_i1.p1  ORF type:complete len:242 (-),score=29.56 TRINITY_DN1235_c0_g1_i1:629-1354(-)
MIYVVVQPHLKRKPDADMMNQQTLLVIGNLPKEGVTNKQIKDLFADFNCTRARIAYRHNVFLGFAGAEFQNEEDASAALAATNGQALITDRPLNVRFAEERDKNFFFKKKNKTQPSPHTNDFSDGDLNPNQIPLGSQQTGYRQTGMPVNNAYPPNSVNQFGYSNDPGYLTSGMSPVSPTPSQRGGYNNPNIFDGGPERDEINELDTLTLQSYNLCKISLIRLCSCFSSILLLRSHLFPVYF